jgi:hypothetical protein
MFTSIISPQDSTVATENAATLMQNPVVWIVGIAALSVVVALAVARGRGLTVGAGPLKIDLSKKDAESGGDSKVQVARGAEFERDVGKVTGIKGTEQASVNRPVDVATDATFKGKVDQITGIDISNKN